jgi:RNA polymerase sigma-70 factor, ECF subfamily
MTDRRLRRERGMRRRARTQEPCTVADAYETLAADAVTLASGMLRGAHSAEDVVQDVFVRLLERPDMYDPTRGPYAALIKVMTRTRAIDEHRRRSRLRSLEALPVVPRLDLAPSPEHTVLARETRRELVMALAELPEEQRTAVLLHDVGDLTHVEAATATHVPLGTMKGRLRLGRKKLRGSVHA